MMFCLTKSFIIAFSLTAEEKTLERSFILALTQSRIAVRVEGKKNLAVESAKAWVEALLVEDLIRSKQREPERELIKMDLALRSSSTSLEGSRPTSGHNSFLASSTLSFSNLKNLMGKAGSPLGRI